MTMVTPKEIRRRIILELYEAFIGRREHAVTREELVRELGYPEWVVEASLLYMDAKGWMSSLLPDGLRISVSGVEVVEDKEKFLEEFGVPSNVILVITGGEEGREKVKGGFDEVYKEVEMSALSDADKEEVLLSLEKVEKKCAEITVHMEELGKGIAQVLKKAEWLRSLLGSVICRMFLGKLNI